MDLSVTFDLKNGIKATVQIEDFDVAEYEEMATLLQDLVESLGGVAPVPAIELHEM